MKLLLTLGMLAAAYAFAMLFVTDTVSGQIQHVNATYQYVAGNADKIAAGRQP